MFARIVFKKNGKQDGESPFWISFSDLMTARMTLFLVVMAVTLVSVTQGISAELKRKVQRENDIRSVMAMIREESKAFPAVKFDDSTYRIDIGEVVRFESGRFDIKPEAAAFIRRYIPVVLNAQSSDLGRRWIRRIVVEGFTDQDGTYLYNLGLSLNRSRSVVCALFAPPGQSEPPLTDIQKRQIRDLFLVGGYSFNSIRANKEESRRVELKLEFWALDEEPVENKGLDEKEFGQC